MRKVILSIAFPIFLSACGATVPVVVDTKHVLVAPEDSQIVNCDSEPPPAKADYMSRVVPKGTDDVAQLTAALQTVEERERKALAWGTSQTRHLTNCSSRMKGVRDLKAKAKKEIEAIEAKKGK
jgi:hypothetical protein